MQSTLYLIVFTVTCCLIIAAAALSGRRAKDEDDFSLAGRELSATGVAWVIIGTLVGGASTIGTVQMAYSHGFAAWYFTLGSGVACLFLGLFFAYPLREAKVVTVAEYLGRFFGPRYRKYSSGLTSLGMFVHVIAQFIAAMAILEAVLKPPLWLSLLLVFLLHLAVVALGGMKGAAWLGRAKCVLLYTLLLVCAALSLVKAGGVGGLINSLPEGSYGLFAYGGRRGMLHLLSVVVGVLSTQTYLQALFSARDVRAARNGAFLSALLIPPVGFLGIIVGLYLRGAQGTGLGATAKALPFFINSHFGEVFSAIFTAILLVVVLGTGAGLSLGVTTNLFNDFWPKEGRGGAGLWKIRLCAVAVLLLALFVVNQGLDSAILEWSYLSMGIRGSAVLFGLIIAVFFASVAKSLLVRVFLYLLPIVALLQYCF
mgnify:CR=1 FL=1